MGVIELACDVIATLQGVGRTQTCRRHITNALLPNCKTLHRLSCMAEQQHARGDLSSLRHSFSGLEMHTDHLAICLAVHEM